MYKANHMYKLVWPKGSRMVVELDLLNDIHSNKHKFNNVSAMWWPKDSVMAMKQQWGAIFRSLILQKYNLDLASVTNVANDDESML